MQAFELYFAVSQELDISDDTQIALGSMPIKLKLIILFFKLGQAQTKCSTDVNIFNSFTFQQGTSKGVGVCLQPGDQNGNFLNIMRVIPAIRVGQRIF